MQKKWIKLANSPPNPLCGHKSQKKRKRKTVTIYATQCCKKKAAIVCVADPVTP
jgi:hypothetical protein